MQHHPAIHLVGTVNGKHQDVYTNVPQTIKFLKSEGFVVEGKPIPYDEWEEMEKSRPKKPQ